MKSLMLTHEGWEFDSPHCPTNVHLQKYEMRSGKYKNTGGFPFCAERSAPCPLFLVGGVFPAILRGRVTRTPGA